MKKTLQKLILLMITILFIIPSSIVAQGDKGDYMNIIIETEQYKKHLGELEVIPMIIDEEGEYIVVEYELPSEGEEGITSIIFVVDKEAYDIVDIYRAYTKYETTLYESISGKIQPRYNSGCNFFKCTEKRKTTKYNPIPGCSMAMTGSCALSKPIPGWGGFIYIGCKGISWVACSFERSSECVKGITYENICIS